MQSDTTFGNIINLDLGLAEFLLAQSPFGVFLVNSEQQIIFVNETLSHILDYSIEELTQSSVNQMFRETEVDELEEIFSHAFSEDSHGLLKPLYKLTAKAKSGRFFQSELRIKPFLQKGFLYCTFQELSTHLSASHKTNQILKRLSAAVDVAQVGTWELDFTNNWLTWDENMYKLIGAKPTDFSSPFSAWDAVLHPDYKDYYEKTTRAILKGKENNFRLEFKIVQPSGEERYLVAKGILERDESDFPIRMVGVDYDVTDIRVKEEEKKRLIEFQKIILNSTNYAIFTKDINGFVSSFNNGAEEMFGYKKEEMIGKESTDRFHESDEFEKRRKELNELHNIDLKNGLEVLLYETENGLDQKRAYNLIRKDGSKFKAVLTVSTLKKMNGDIEGYMTIARDVTEERQKENKARELSNFRNFIIESNNYAIFTEGTDNQFSSFNTGAEKMLGYTAEEMIGKARPMILHDTNEFGSRAKYLSEKYNTEVLPGLDSLLFEAKHGLDRIHYWTFIKKDGTRIKVHLSVTELLNDKKEHKGQLAIAYDVTNKWEAEQRLEKNAKTLERKNKELEQFTYIASHDLQEPLRTIANFTGLVSKNPVIVNDPKLKQYFQFINQGTERMQNLVKCLMDYSLLGKTVEFVQVDLQEIAEEITLELKDKIEEKKATINFSQLPKVDGITFELKQLFLNLISNGLKFQKKGVNPVINIKASFMRGKWQFCISDNGIGIDDKYKNKIFMIFQRLDTENKSKGHGIGLSHCKKIVEHHGGQIWVESILNEGSQFYFTLSNTKNQ